MPVLCVDIGGTSTKAGLFNGSPLVHILDSLASIGPAESFAAALCEMLKRLTVESIDGIGIAVAGFVNEERDRMVYNSNLPWLENYPIKARLMEEFNTRVEVEVDANAAALAEQRFGAGRSSRRFLCLAIGTGLGVGMIINGEPVRFAYGCLGDPGHIIVQRDGPLCSCGGRGCAELYVSAPLLAEQYRAAIGSKGQLSLRDVIVAARNGDRAAVRILQEAGAWLGVATASLANMFVPDTIAYAGGLAEAGDLLLDSVRESFQTSASKFVREGVTLCRATLGANATITGAACALISSTSNVR